MDRTISALCVLKFSFKENNFKIFYIFVVLSFKYFDIYLAFILCFLLLIF